MSNHKPIKVFTTNEWLTSILNGGNSRKDGMITCPMKQSRDPRQIPLRHANKSVQVDFCSAKLTYAPQYEKTFMDRNT